MTETTEDIFQRDMLKMAHQFLRIVVILNPPIEAGRFPKFIAGV